MKNFINIDTNKVQELVEQLMAEHHVFPVVNRTTKACHMKKTDHYVYTLAIEYIGEVWRNEYDDEDVDFVLENLYFEPATGVVFILEMQGYPEREELVFEDIWHPRWSPITKWEVVLETDMSLLEVDKLINFADQGWFNAGNDEYHSLMVILRKFLTVETADIELYVKAVNSVGGDIQIVDYYPAD